MARVLFLLLIIPITVCGQRNLNLTLFGGFSNYSGELQEKRFTLEQSKKAFGVGLSLFLNSKVSLNGTIRRGTLYAHDRLSSNEDNRARNLQFATNIYEAALQAEYYPLDPQNYLVSPYVGVGLALFRFNPWSEAGSLRDLSTEGQGFVDGRKPYSLFTITIPMTIGFKIRINEKTFLGYDIGIRKTFTDYIDDVSRSYVDENVLRNNRGQVAVDYAFRGDEIDRTLSYPAPGTLRGSPQTKDWYYFSGITLSFSIMNEDGKLFGKRSMKGSVDCPKW